jgi:hypothetical protein
MRTKYAASDRTGLLSIVLNQEVLANTLANPTKEGSAEGVNHFYLLCLLFFLYYNSYHYSTVPYNNFVFLGKDGNTDDAIDAVDKIISKLHIDENFNAYLNDEAVQASTVI